MQDVEPSEKQPIVAPPGTVCRACWHGLKGLSYGSVCPECGASIGAAMDPLWWGNGPTEPLNRLLRAIGKFLWGVASMFALFAVTFTASVLRAPSGPSALGQFVGFVASAAWVWLVLALWAAMNASAAAGLVGRRLSRFGGVAALLSASACVVSEAVTVFYPDYRSGWAAVPRVGFALASVSVLALWAFAQRSAAFKIRRQPLRSLSWLQAACASFAVAAFALGMTPELYDLLFPMRVPPTWFYGITKWLEWPMMADIGALLLLMLVDLVLMRSALRRFLHARSAAA